MKKFFCFVSILFLVLTAISSQEFSEKQTISIFKLNYFGAPVYDPGPEVQIKGNFREGSFSVRLRGSGDSYVDGLFQQAIGAIDANIIDVFVNLGRFDVIGQPQRLSTDNVQAFIDALKDMKEQNIEIPEAVRLGEQAFTEADFNRLIGSFIIVIPTVTFYTLEELDSGDFQATVQTSFAFVNVEENRTFASFIIETTGIDANGPSAMREAVNDIPFQLEFEVRSVEEFQIKTGILELYGNEIVLEFGKNMGIQPGDEYSVLKYGTVAGYENEVVAALILITEVQENFSRGQIIYNNEALYVGDQLREIPRTGVEFVLYSNGYLPLTSDAPSGFKVGLKTIPSRGFSGFRPLGGLEVVITPNLYSGISLVAGYIPASIYFGGEYKIHLGRLKLNPAAAVGITGFFTTDSTKDQYFSHINLRADLNVGFLVDDAVEIFGSFGYDANIALTPDLLPTFSGFTVGGGILFKP